MTNNISFQEAAALAKAGDAEAQYALSSALHQRGQFDESLHWLRLAAAQGFAQAQITLAMFLIDGRQCARDLQRAIDLLQPLAAAQAQANILLSEVYGFASLGCADIELGLRYLLVAAKMGDACALRQFALLSACHERFDLTRPLFDAAARRGDAAAMYALACCYAEGIGGATEPALAARMINTEIARGQYLAPRLQENLRKRNFISSAVSLPALKVDWLQLEQALPQFAADIRLPPAEVLRKTPFIRRFANVFHSLILDTVINLAAPLVKRSQIVDATTGEVRPDPMRTSSHVTLGPRQHDHVIETIERCIGRVSGLPVLQGEFLQILRYRIGEEFRPHVDYFNEVGASSYQSLADGGQRAQTVLLYLNDEYTGGSTRFPQLQLDVNGHRGDILHFHNLRADGAGDRDTLHAGMPVLTGEKWLLSKWIRSESYPPRIAW